MASGLFLRGIFPAILLLFVNLCFAEKADTSFPVNQQNKPQVGLLKGPYLQSATSTSMIIRWRTDAAELGWVKYGMDSSNLDKIARATEVTKEHIIKLPALTPSTRYYYSIGSSSGVLQSGADQYFKTPPVPGTTDTYRIAAFGDCGNNSANQRSVRDNVLKHLGDNYLDAWLLLGDNAYEYGTDAEYQRNFFNVFKDDLLKNYPLYPAPGNHDYREKDIKTGLPKLTHDVAYYKNFSMPVDGEAGGVASKNPSYYSFDLGNIHFLSLDSYGKEEGGARLYDTMSAQVQWVKKDLEANKNKEWIIAYWHHPPYTMTSHNSDRETELVKIRENFLKVLERLGVDLVLSGHSHAYERTRLINGHYSYESSFDADKHNVSNSTGLYDGSSNSCPYIKDSTENKGVVYVVSGSAGKIDTSKQKTYPHDAMYYSNPMSGGAVFLEVTGNRLDLNWICGDGVIRDHFTMMKNAGMKTKLHVNKGEEISLSASFNGDYKWSNGEGNSKTIKVIPTKKKSTYKVQDGKGCIEDVFEVKISK